MDLHMDVSQKEVENLLTRLDEVVSEPDFDPCRDVILISKDKPDDREHSTPFTLLDLDFDVYDVVDQLKELTVDDFAEAVADWNDTNPLTLFIIGKLIHDRLIFIKFKIREEPETKVVCVSFHYAKEPLEFPYRQNYIRR